MNAHEQTIRRFYESFRSLDAEGMIACYHPQIIFSDPVFGVLAGEEATGMWRMLCARAKGLTISFSDVTAPGTVGGAHWEADYTFSQTGRSVHNVVNATFAFEDDKIVRHADRFNLWKWTAMALGPAGILLGWSPIVRGKVRKGARRGLEVFLEDRRMK